MTAALIGVDLGGTSIRAAVATGDVTHGEPVHPRHAVDATARRPCSTLSPSARARPPAARTIHGLAIGIPGPVDPRAGIVHDTPNMTGWNEVPAAAMLSERVGCPVVICHDAAAAGYAELKAGAGTGRTPSALHHRQHRDRRCAVHRRRPVRRRNRLCRRGRAHADQRRRTPRAARGIPGCLEGTSSGTAIAARARARRWPPASRRRCGTSTPPRSTRAPSRPPRTPATRSRCGCSTTPVTRSGRAIGGFINVLAPDVIVIGGGLIHAGDLLLGPARTAATQIAFEIPYSRCKIVTAALGTDAGLIGAVAWAVRSFSGRPVEVL